MGQDTKDLQKSNFQYMNGKQTVNKPPSDRMNHKGNVTMQRYNFANTSHLGYVRLPLYRMGILLNTEKYFSCTYILKRIEQMYIGIE